MKLLIIDGHSLAYRCYYAVKNSPSGLLVSLDQVPITICSGFLKSLAKLLREHTPTHLTICFDSEGKTWRHKLYPKYKANRVKDPEEKKIIYIDLRNLQAILKEKAIAVSKLSGCEADDLIATICNQIVNQELGTGNYELDIVIASGDKDLLQLVNDDLNISVHHLHKNSKIYSEKDVIEEYGVEPHRVPDFKALVGDDSDNIPGIDGIGRISAFKLLNSDQSPRNAEAIAFNLDKIPPTFAKKIKGQTEKLLLFKKLTQLDNIVLPANSFEINQFSNTDLSKQSSMAEELGVKT